MFTSIGGLSVLSGIYLMQHGLPQPAGSVLLSPWIDMSLRAHQGGNALVETDYVVNANTMLPLYVKRWLDGLPATSVEVNPLYYKPDQIKGLNPQLIFVGAAEFALQEAKDLAILYKRAHIKHELVVEWGQLHIYALGSKWIDQEVRKKTDAKIVGWMKQCVLDSHATNIVTQ
jgi:acetyl esterase/lipase